MAWNAGTYSRAGGSTNWADDRDASTEIEAGLHDTHDEDLANGINSCLEKSGSNSMTGNLNFGNNKGTNCTDPTAAQDVATKAYVDTGGVFLASNDELLCRLATHTTVPSGFTIGTVADTAVKIIGNTAASADAGTNNFDTVFVNTYAGTISAGAHTHTFSGNTGQASAASTTAQAGATNAYTILTHFHTYSGTTVSNGAHTHNVTIAVKRREFHTLVKT